MYAYLIRPSRVQGLSKNSSSSYQQLHSTPSLMRCAKLYVTLRLFAFHLMETLLRLSWVVMRRRCQMNPDCPSATYLENIV